MIGLSSLYVFRSLFLASERRAPLLVVGCRLGLAAQDTLLGAAVEHDDKVAVLVGIAFVGARIRAEDALWHER